MVCSGCGRRARNLSQSNAVKNEPQIKPTSISKNSNRVVAKVTRTATKRSYDKGVSSFASLISKLKSNAQKQRYNRRLR